jgi:hypothetical protein
MFNGVHSKLTRHTFALWNRNSVLQISSKTSAALNALPRMGYRLHLLHLVPVVGPHVSVVLNGFVWLCMDRLELQKWWHTEAEA